MAAMTKINTSTGATALSAAINSVPKIATLGVAAGHNTAKAMPTSRPITICVTKLVRFAQRSRGLKIMEKNPGNGTNSSACKEVKGTKKALQKRFAPTQ